MMFKSNNKSPLLAALLSGALIAAFSGQALSYSGGSGSDCSKELIESTKTWFPHKDTPEPDGTNFVGSDICEFNAWAWQTFLWATQEYKGQPRFLSYQSPYDLLGIESREVLKPHAGHSVFDEIAQAGPGGILVDQNGNVVYYSQYLNPEWVSFVKSNNFTDPAVVQAMDPDTEFPINAVEYKASWRVVETGEDTRNVFTMMQEVYGLKNEGGQIVVDTSKIRNIELALVGLHIGGIVKGHPEMIWATFEHNNNSPIVPADFTPDTVIADSGDFTFFNTNPPETVPEMTNTYAGCNKNYVASPYMKLDQATQKLSPITQVCLQYKHGNMATFDLSPDPEINKGVQSTIDSNNAGIVELNTLVHDNLGDNLWANYHEVGAIWFKGNDLLKPDMSLATDFNEDGSQLLIGSIVLSNSTIETYTQYASTQNNCFRCHNTQQRLLDSSSGLISLKASNLNVSYAFSNIYTWAQMIANENK